MADSSVVSRYTNFPYIIQNPTVNSVHCCLKCSDLERQLEESHMELSFSQLIVRLLYKELKDITTQKTTMQCDSTPKYNTSDDDVSANTWIKITSKHQHNKYKTSNSIIYQETEPIEDYKRYAILPNLPEANDYPNKNMAHNSNINTRISKDSTYNGIQKRLRGKTKHSLSIRCQRNAVN